MKKIFLALLVLLSIFEANASGDYSEKTFCAGISFPYINNDYNVDDFDFIKINAVGLNLNARRMKSDMKIGIFLDADIFLPYTKVIIWDDKYQTTTTRSDYEYFYGLDALAGIYGILLQNESINVPFGVGFHIDGLLSKQKSNNYVLRESGYTLGIGAWVNFEVSVTKHVGIFAGSKFNYDFYYKISSKSQNMETNEGKCKGLSFIPAIGLTWYF